VAAVSAKILVLRSSREVTFAQSVLQSQILPKAFISSGSNLTYSLNIFKDAFKFMD